MLFLYGFEERKKLKKQRKNPSTEVLMGFDFLLFVKLILRKSLRMHSSRTSDLV